MRNNIFEKISMARLLTNRIIFIKEFMFHYKEIGSLLPSSNFLARKITDYIDFRHAKVIVELGAGTGKFTDFIVSKKQKDTIFIVFELDNTFYKLLKSRYKNINNVIIINDCASKLNDYLVKLNINNVDYIVSGLPFLNIFQQKREAILQTISDSNAKYIILFQYTLRLKNLFKVYFSLIHQDRVYKNFPPAYVLCFENKK